MDDVSAAANEPEPGAGDSPDSLFDPSNLEWERVSPKLARLWLVVAALWFGPVSAAVLVAGLWPWKPTSALAATVVSEPESPLPPRRSSAPTRTNNWEPGNKPTACPQP
jgi:hypothetical protein